MSQSNFEWTHRKAFLPEVILLDLQQHHLPNLLYAQLLYSALEMLN